jgi:hypothetical protein
LRKSREACRNNLPHRALRVASRTISAELVETETILGGPISHSLPSASTLSSTTLTSAGQGKASVKAKGQAQTFLTTTPKLRNGLRQALALVTLCEQNSVSLAEDEEKSPELQILLLNELRNNTLAIRDVLDECNKIWVQLDARLERDMQQLFPEIEEHKTEEQSSQNAVESLSSELQHVEQTFEAYTGESSKEISTSTARPRIIKKRQQQQSTARSDRQHQREVVAELKSVLALRKPSTK